MRNLSILNWRFLFILYYKEHLKRIFQHQRLKFTIFDKA